MACGNQATAHGITPASGVTQTGSRSQVRISIFIAQAAFYHFFAQNNSIETPG
jgi:hypothetical protein